MINSRGTQPSSSSAVSPRALADPIESALATSIGYLLARTGMESRRLWTRMLAEHELTPHQFGVITALSNMSNASQKQLSAMLGIDPRNSMAVFDGLEERGLIERGEDPDDRRRHSVHLTRAGQRKAVELRRTGEATEREMLKGLSVPERRTLHGLLIKLFETMSA